jgi:hypothetical protein
MMSALKYIAATMLIIVLMQVSLVAQNRWTKIYHTEKDAVGLNLSLGYDKGYLLAGKHGHNYVNYNWLIKTDINGKYYGKSLLGILQPILTSKICLLIISGTYIWWVLQDITMKKAMTP